MHYRYSVLSETGNEITGILEGSWKSVKESLSQKNYYILSLEPDLLRSVRTLLGRKKIKARILAIFFEDLVNMLKTGIAMNEAVIALMESNTEPVLTKALAQINDDLANGFSLTQAFKRTEVFPELVLSVLKVGEKSGSLEQVLDDLAKYYLREADFVLNLRNAVSYPAIVFSLLIGIMFYVSFKVIPHLQALLPLKENAYFATRLVLSLSRFLKDFWFVCLAFPIGLVFVYSRFKKSQVERIASFYYNIPLVGEVIKDISFSTLFSNLAVLQKNGISIVDGLTLIHETTSYRFLSQKILKLKELVLSGLSFWQAMEKDSFFPAFVYYAVRKGEEMGSLDEYLESLSKYYFDKVTRRIRVILGFIQPMLLIFCAGILLLIVLAFIIPVYGNLSNIAGGNIKF